MIVWPDGTFCGGVGNASFAPRREGVVSYCLGWLKPFELQQLVFLTPTAGRATMPKLTTDLNSGPPAAITAASVNRIFFIKGCAVSLARKAPSVQCQNRTSFV